MRAHRVVLGRVGVERVVNRPALVPGVVDDLGPAGLAPGAHAGLAERRHRLRADVEGRREEHEVGDRVRGRRAPGAGAAACRTAVCQATKPPRLEPMRATGPGGRAAIVASTCPIIRVVVSVEKSGSLRSGQCSAHPQRGEPSGEERRLRRSGGRREAVQVDDMHHGRGGRAGAHGATACSCSPDGSGTRSPRRRRCGSRRSALRPRGWCARRGSRSRPSMMCE